MTPKVVIQFKHCHVHTCCGSLMFSHSNSFTWSKNTTTSHNTSSGNFSKHKVTLSTLLETRWPAGRQAGADLSQPWWAFHTTLRTAKLINHRIAHICNVCELSTFANIHVTNIYIHTMCNNTFTIDDVIVRWLVCECWQKLFIAQFLEFLLLLFLVKSCNLNVKEPPPQNIFHENLPPLIMTAIYNIWDDYVPIAITHYIQWFH